MKEFLKKKYNLLRARKRLIKLVYWRLLNIGYRLNVLSIYDVPLVINNFNRLTFIQKLLTFLEECGFTNIIILDNNSNYPPLLEFYKICRHKVIREKYNYGHLAFWKSGLYNKYKWNYFIYSDADVLPIEACPKNFIEYFKLTMDKYPQLDKIGFGIKINDLPDFFSLKKKVVDYEKQYWKKEVKQNIYDAPIDTTFALYKPFSNLKGGESYTLSAFRLDFPYLIRHLPWYVDSRNLTAEEINYMETCNNSSSMAKERKGNESVY